MKHGLILTVAFLLVAACGQEEPAPAPADDPMVDADEAAVETPAPETAPSDDGETRVVEESAAEPTDDEQAIVLAQAEVPAADYDFKYSEGRHYARLVPTQPTWGGADKIEVAEFFWYGCPHCYTFEPTVNNWVQNDKPANVRFVRIPAMWNNILVLHARLFFTEQVLGRNGVIKNPEEFRNAVFEEYHRRGNRLTSESSIQRLFERFGVSADDFSKTWNSFEVDQNLRKAEDLARRYGIASVPAVVVNGKYRTGAQEAGGYAEWIELIDELIIRESAR